MYYQHTLRHPHVEFNEIWLLIPYYTCFVVFPAQKPHEGAPKSGLLIIYPYFICFVVFSVDKPSKGATTSVLLSYPFYKCFVVFSTNTSN